jgi:hypothetical protein
MLFGEITQVGFVTRDIRASMNFYVDQLGIGPWFIADRVVSTHNYRGTPQTFVLSVAMAASGGLQLELMQQHDDVPSMYHDWMLRPFARELQQHICFWPDDYDAKLVRAHELGYGVVQDGATARGRFVYLAHPRDPDQVVEITEQTPARRAFNAAIARAAVGWTGEDRIRPFSAAG